jgi:hypothetical protein
MKILFPMRDALSDPQLLAGALPGESWAAWRILLIAAAGERLTRAERKVFKRLTGRAHEPGRLVDLFLGVIGRRGGKSKAMATFMVWLATCVDWTDILSLGERGVALIVAPTERQAKVTEDYVRAIIDNAPLLASLVDERTQSVLTLKRQVGIEVLAANARFVRGVTAIGVCLDECAYLPSNEDSVNSDTSLLEALRPTVSTTGGPLLLTSSPATTTGIVHTLWKRFYGKPDRHALVVQSDTRGTNPDLRQSVIDRAFEEDAASASAEYGGQFREPLSAFLTREIVERCVDRGVTERQPLPGVVYQCFLDVASGSGTDSFAAAIGHRSRDGDRDVVVVDALYEARPPFDPLAIVALFAGHLQRWGITCVTGDSYSANFIVSAFAKYAITYTQSKPGASELYLAALPAFTSRTLALLDQPRAVDQLVNLRRKIGQAGAESVTHMRGTHDDLANVICGLVHLCTPHQQAISSWEIPGVVTGPRITAPYADASASNDTTLAWLRTQGRSAPMYTAQPGERSIHGDGAPLKGSPMSNRNAIY